ncbi:hypothetical protein KIN20_000317 [Parelaphostrongylus tenuis]|uniref:Uncharacterized protein n=1 Tax=Parelaphostrongylus tenuis TaxID=148309 RepID=A0AAD5MDF5_PARTN|nr:hypothetical protein KIN20_000317 [Parelaphostrongylus tenuis]
MPEETLRNPIRASMWKWIGIEIPAGHPQTFSMEAQNCEALLIELRTGTLVYSSGSPCKNGGKCTSSKNGLCEDGLCVIDA